MNTWTGVPRMPPRVPPETVKRFDALLLDGYNVMAAARACQVSKDWAYNRSKGRNGVQMRSHDLGNDSVRRGIPLSRIGEERRADLGQERDAHDQHVRHPRLGLAVLRATGLAVVARADVRAHSRRIPVG